MLTVTGIVVLAFGGLLYAGQLLSTVDFALAQKLGLQEKAENADALFSHLELNAARWDLFVLWTLPAAGILMLLGHAWWPYAALVAGGVSVDTGGRETAKVFALKREGVRVGAPKEYRLVLGVFGGFLVVGLWLVVYGLWALG